MKITSISLLVAFFAALFSFLQFNRTQTALQNTHQSLLQLEDELGSKIDSLKKQQAQSQISNTLNHPLEADHLARFEIELFIHLAATQLRNAEDPATSVELLKGAQQTLQALQDPKLDLLKKTLEHDVQALTSMQQAKLTTWQSITALMDETQHLQPRHTPTRQALVVAPVTSPTPSEKVWSTTWKTLVFGILDNLKNLIKVQRHTKPIEPLLSDTEQRLVQQQLRLLLEQWRLSALMVDQALYNRLSEDIQQCLDNYYDPNEPKVLSLEQSLKMLKDLSLNKNYPSLTCLDHLSDLRT